MGRVATYATEIHMAGILKDPLAVYPCGYEKNTIYTNTLYSPLCSNFPPWNNFNTIEQIVRRTSIDSNEVITSNYSMCKISFSYVIVRHGSSHLR